MVTKRGKVFQILITEGKNENLRVNSGGQLSKVEIFTKICVAASLETLREDPTVRIRDKQAVWKLLSKISRTAPA